MGATGQRRKKLKCGVWVLRVCVLGGVGGEKFMDSPVRDPRIRDTRYIFSFSLLHAHRPDQQSLSRDTWQFRPPDVFHGMLRVAGVGGWGLLGWKGGRDMRIEREVGGWGFKRELFSGYGRYSGFRFQTGLRERDRSLVRPANPGAMV